MANTCICGQPWADCLNCYPYDSVPQPTVAVAIADTQARQLMVSGQPKVMTTTKPLYPPARILTGMSGGLIMPFGGFPYQRKVIVGGQHKAAEFVHPFLNTNTES